MTLDWQSRTHGHSLHLSLFPSPPHTSLSSHSLFLTARQAKYLNLSAKEATQIRLSSAINESFTNAILMKRTYLITFFKNLTNRILQTIQNRALMGNATAAHA